MDVTLAVLADYANVTKEGKTNILGIFDIMYSKTFPFVWNTMQLVIRFKAPRSEANTTKSVLVKLLDADGKQILEIGGQFTLGKPNNNAMNIQTNQFLVLNNLKFEKPGDYVFSVLVNGDEKSTVPLKVVKIK